MTKVRDDERVGEDAGRAVVRCKVKTCGYTARVEYVTRTVYGAFNGRPTSRSTLVVAGREFSLGRGFDTRHALAAYTRNVCPGCGASYTLTVNVVRGVVVETKPCGARCMGAVGPACECECGGENHGGGHAQF